MATAFSEKEKDTIRIKLRSAAQECLSKTGVKKTTVEQLTKMAGISKGAFYIFYPSKEVLFFAVLEEYQHAAMEEVTNQLNETEQFSIQKFSTLIHGLYRNIHQSFIMNIIQNQEMEHLMRKLPEELITNHHSFDDMLAQKLFSNLKVKEGFDVGVVTASFRAIFMTMLHVKEIGERDFEEVLKLLIDGLANQLLEEDSNDQ